MLKISPIFPQSTKQKYTSTSSTAINSQSLQKSSRYFLGININKTLPDFQRILQLSQPRKIYFETNNQKCLSTNSSFFHKSNYQSQIKNMRDKNQPNLSSLFKEQNKSKPNAMATTFSFIKRANKINNARCQLKYPKIFDRKIIKQLMLNQKKDRQMNKQVKNKNQTENLFQRQTIFKKSIAREDKQLCYQNKLFIKNRKLKQQKQQVSYEKLLPSSDLASIYNSLYSRYESKPFNQLQQQQPILINLLQTVKLQKQKQLQAENQKYVPKKQRKSFQIKQLQFQKTLRKQIKSLTRDTDHILSLEFKDIRDINNR